MVNAKVLANLKVHKMQHILDAYTVLISKKKHSGAFEVIFKN